MNISREQHATFLDLEIKAQLEEFKKTAESSALQLLKKDELYLAQFLKEDNGQLILRFSNKRGIPRKNQFVLGLLLPRHLVNYKEWGNKSYKELIQQKFIHSELHCVWQRDAGDGKHIVAGFRGCSLQFSDRLVPKCLIVLGPNVPPLEYLRNLKIIVEKTPPESEAGQIIDIDKQKNQLSPTLVSESDDSFHFFLSQLHLSKTLLIQGPPGTGKTFLISQLCKRFLEEKKSILVTALTNRALIEVAGKEPLNLFCREGNVKKAGLTLDEERLVPGVKDCSEINSIKGELVLATFYRVSNLTKEIHESPIFDVVIIDEASQAFLSTFASIKSLGKKNIWIGDPSLMPPIVVLNDELLMTMKAKMAVEGMITLSTSYPVPFYQLLYTYRLTKRASDYTGIFYKKLVSKSSLKLLDLSYSNLEYPLNSFFHSEGGPTLLKMGLSPGNKKPANGIMAVAAIVDGLLSSNPELEIAVLSFYVKTVTSLQKYIFSKVPKGEKILIDTVSRVQGLTVDVCLYFIPNVGYIRSLDRALFNVATSRAKRHTLIIADPDVLESNLGHLDVSRFLKKLDLDYSIDLSQYYSKKIGKGK